MLNTRENFMRLMRCEIPEYVSTYSIRWGLKRPSCYTEGRNPDNTGTDYLGIEWVIENSAFQAVLPKPGVFILDDIRKWRDIVKVPDFSGLDWEAMAKKDKADWDPTQEPYGGTTAPGGQGFFQVHMALMGFNEGLLSCFEEPDEVKALMEYLCDWAIDNAKRLIKYYEPDMGMYADDIAHERAPFVSLDMFRDLYYPYWKKYTDVFLDAGIPVIHHDCGYLEEYLDDFVELGFTAWDPVQISNDAVSIKEKYGNKLALCMGLTQPDSWRKNPPNEDEVRSFVKGYLDKLAPGGGLAIVGGPPPPQDTPLNPMQQRSVWIWDEFEKIKDTYY
jgi:hypothetical protein